MQVRNNTHLAWKEIYRIKSMGNKSFWTPERLVWSKYSEQIWIFERWELFSDKLNVCFSGSLLEEKTGLTGFVVFASVFAGWIRRRHFSSSFVWKAVTPLLSSSADPARPKPVHWAYCSSCKYKLWNTQQF